MFFGIELIRQLWIKKIRLITNLYFISSTTKSPIYSFNCISILTPLYSKFPRNFIEISQVDEQENEEEYAKWRWSRYLQFAQYGMFARPGSPALRRVITRVITHTYQLSRVKGVSHPYRIWRYVVMMRYHRFMMIYNGNSLNIYFVLKVQKCEGFMP